MGEAMPKNNLHKMKQIRSILIVLVALLAIATNSHAQTTQNVTGKVFDDASKAPLPGAVVMLVNAHPPIGTATDADGNFKLTNVPLGRQVVKVSYTGYEDRIIPDVLVTAGKEVNLSISMQEALHKLNEVTVTYNRSQDKTRTNNDMAQVSARSFNVDETKRYAGALGDPARMASNFAGVVSGDDARNDIIVRGNSPSGMLWQLEGLNIPNINHYGSLDGTGGPVSMINNNNIAKSDFLTSAFPSQYGNALAGVFDIKLRDGNKNKSEFMGQIGFNGFEVGAEGPLGKHTSYLLNYRYSVLGVFQKMGISFGTGAATPLYQDLNYKVTSQLSKRSTLTFFGIAGNSNISFLGKDVDTTTPELFSGDPYANNSSKYGTLVAGLSYGYQVSEKTHTRLTVGFSGTSEQFNEDSVSYSNPTLFPSFKAKNTTGKMSATWMWKHKISAKDNVETGATFDYTNFSLLMKDLNPGGIPLTYYDQTDGYGLAQAYAQWKHRFNEKLSTVAGLHAQYMTLNGDYAAEPRASLRYAFSRRQALSIGYGLHHQAQNIFTYFLQTRTAAGYVLTNQDLGFTRSHHAVATYDWNITDRLRLKIEGYYQALGNVPIQQTASSFSALNSGSGFGPDATDSLVNKGTGYNYGTELTLERFFSKGYYFLVTTSVFNSKYKGSDGIERNTSFNTGYVLNVLGGKEFRLGTKGSVLALNLKLCSVGGRYVTPLDLERSKAEGKAVLVDSKAFTEQQGGYFRTDFRIAYRKEYRKSTLEVAIDLQNITDHKNIFMHNYDARANKLVTVYQQSFFPVPMVRYTF
jgi:hypothetical protein